MRPTKPSIAQLLTTVVIAAAVDESKVHNPELEKILNHDPMGNTSSDDMSDDQTRSLLGDFMLLNQLKAGVLETRGDTPFTMSTIGYMVTIEAAGYKKLYEQKFRSGQVRDDGNYEEETFYIYWKDGILLVWDTFWGNRNAATAYCEVEFKQEGPVTVAMIEGMYKQTEGLSLSGLCFSHNSQQHESDTYYKRGPEGRQWDGWWSRRSAVHFDAREAFLYHDTKVREIFKMATDKWRESHFMWLLHRGDTKIEGYDSKAITNARIALLPEHVQNMIKDAHK